MTWLGFAVTSLHCFALAARSSTYFLVSAIRLFNFGSEVELSKHFKMNLAVLGSLSATFSTARGSANDMWRTTSAPSMSLLARLPGENIQFLGLPLSSVGRLKLRRICSKKGPNGLGLASSYSMTLHRPYDGRLSSSPGGTCTIQAASPASATSRFNACLTVIFCNSSGPTFLDDFPAG